MTQVQLAIRIHHKSQDVSALEGHQDSAHGPELLSVNQGLRVIGEVAGPKGTGVAGRHPVGQRSRARSVGLVNLDKNGLIDPKGSAGENQSPLLPGVLQAGHSLVIKDFDVGSPEVVEAEVALELGREEVGVLGIEGFCGMGQVVAVTWKLSSCRLRSHRLTERRVSSVSRRSDGRRMAVKERGRRQSGGMISLSVGKDKRKQNRYRFAESDNIQESAKRYRFD